MHVKSIRFQVPHGSLSGTNSLDSRNRLVRLIMIPRHCVRPIAAAIRGQRYHYQLAAHRQHQADGKQHCQLCLVSSSPQTHTHEKTHKSLLCKHKLECNGPINQKVVSLGRRPITTCDKRLEITPSRPSISIDFCDAGLRAPLWFLSLPAPENKLMAVRLLNCAPHFMTAK